jgi:catechol 2,3-dioxygenase-like lactoylglutathione lyase family enzyme
MSVQVPAAVAITGIACVYITVSDVYASTQWYVKNLGMEVSHYTPLVPEMGYAMLTCPSPGWSVFLLGSGVICPPAFRRRDGEEPLNCCFYVTDSQALLDRLKAHGVRLETEELVEWGGCDTNLRCYDPDGNKLEFCQPQS